MVVAVLALAAVPASARTIRIVAFGDSNTYGYGVPRTGTWPAQLQNLLRGRGYDVTITNAGGSGDTTIDALRRFDKAFPTGTDAAIVFFGRNDWRKGTPASAISHNLAIILGRLQQRGISVLLIGFKPLNFSAVAKEYGALYHPDFFDGVTFLNLKRRRYTLRHDIDSHLNADGYAVVASHLLPSAEALIARVGK